VVRCNLSTSNRIERVKNERMAREEFKGQKRNGDSTRSCEFLSANLHRSSFVLMSCIPRYDCHMERNDFAEVSKTLVRYRPVNQFIGFIKIIM